MERHVQKGAQLLLGVFDDVDKGLGAVAHLHDAHAGATIVGKLLLDALDNAEREGARA
jgi:hypothetical protein